MKSSLPTTSEWRVIRELKAVTSTPTYRQSGLLPSRRATRGRGVRDSYAFSAASFDARVSLLSPSVYGNYLASQSGQRVPPANPLPETADMTPLETYLQDLHEIRSTGSGVKETSYYPALSNLLNEVGKRLKPRVRCVMNLANRRRPSGWRIVHRGAIPEGLPMPNRFPVRSRPEE